MKLKPTALAISAALTLGTAALAPTAAHAEEAASPVTYNVGVVSDYRYRGITKSRFLPALQGGADYANGPFYAGTWLSTIKWVKDAGDTFTPPVDTGNAPVEWDLYLGTKGDLVKDTLSYDVGTLAYVYLGEKFHNAGLANPDTGEFYGALTAGPVTGKVSISATNLFGVPDSKGSAYYDLSATFDLTHGFSLVPHVGHQSIRHNSPLSYTDYSLTLGKDFGSGITGSLAVVGTDADKTLYYTPSGKFTGRTGAVVGVKYSF